MSCERLFGNLSRHGNSIALLDTSGNVTTYRDLEARARELNSNLQQRSLILILCSNTVDAVVGYVGLASSGHVCLMASATLSNDRISALVQRFRPNFLFADFRRVSDIGLKVVTSVGSYVLAHIDSGERHMFCDLSLLMSTSGSTGSPQMVRQSYENVWSNADAIARSLSLRTSDRAITTMPMNYTYGLSIIHSQLHIGGSVILSELPLIHRGFWQTIEEIRPTYFGGVPYTYEMLDRLGSQRIARGSIRMLTQAGGRLEPVIAQKIHAETSSMGIDFHIMYGQTEATARMSVLHSADVGIRPNSIGRPLPGGAFRVLNLESGKPVKVGEVGELEYSGPNVALGYAEAVEDLTKGDDWKRVLRTGDLAKYDENGFYYVVGRKKRFTKLYGIRVSFDHVELFLSSKGISAACGAGDDRLKVYIEGVVEAIEIRKEVASFIGVNENAVQVIPVKELPRSESGKIEYAHLEKLGGI